jgi:CRP-like cAMP-binding protein
VLAQQVPAARLCSDLDRALQQAEDVLIERHRPGSLPTPADDPGAASLFRGLDAQAKALLMARMTPRTLAAGDSLLRAGDPSDELLLVLEGSGSVLVAGGSGLGTASAWTALVQARNPEGKPG